MSNIFDRFYLGRISTAANSKGYIASNGVNVAPGTPYFYIGAPQFISATFRAAF